MKIGYLKEILNNVDEDKELSLLIDFPDLTDWRVSTHDIAVTPSEEDESLRLEASIFLADFDYPEILKKLKDIALRMPEEKSAND